MYVLKPLIFFSSLYESKICHGSDFSRCRKWHEQVFRFYARSLTCISWPFFISLRLPVLSGPKPGRVVFVNFKNHSWKARWLLGLLSRLLPCRRWARRGKGPEGPVWYQSGIPCYHPIPTPGHNGGLHTSPGHPFYSKIQNFPRPKI